MPALKSKVVLLRLMNKKKDALELSDKLLNINSKDPQLYFEKAQRKVFSSKTYPKFY